MKKYSTLLPLSYAVFSVLSGQAQQLDMAALSMPQPPTGSKIMKVLPADLPREKILFIKYVPIPLEKPRPQGYDRQMYGQRRKHNELLVEANEQLLAAAPQYPYAYRVTTLDSVPYYHKSGYKYLLMEGFFNAYLNVKIGTANGPVPFYVSDLDKDDVYIFDRINSEAIYYYKYQMKLFLKKVDHQFHSKKE